MPYALCIDLNSLLSPFHHYFKITAILNSFQTHLYQIFHQLLKRFQHNKLHLCRRIKQLRDVNSDVNYYFEDYYIQTVNVHNSYKMVMYTNR